MTAEVCEQTYLEKKKYLEKKWNGNMAIDLEKNYLAYGEMLKARSKDFLLLTKRK